MPIAIIAIGIPGSGKTTFLKDFARRHDFAYVNKDTIRGELLGDVTDQSRNKAVWQESERRITDALSTCQGVVLDATHAERWKRVALINSLKKRGAHKVLGVYFDIPYERALMQNAARENVVAEKTMEWFRDQLMKEPPILAEGYDVLYSADEVSELDRAITDG